MYDEINNKYGSVFINKCMINIDPSRYNTLKYNVKLSKEFINNILISRPFTHNKREILKYENFICDILKINITIEEIDDNLLKKLSKNKYLIVYIQYIIEELSIVFPLECFNIAIINNNYNLLSLLKDKFKYKFDILSLEIACKYSNIKTINIILNNKIIPNQKCLKNILMNIIPHDIIRDKCGIIIGKSMESIPQIQTIIDNGYILVQDDFELLTQKYLYLNNYKNYGLVINDRILNICNKKIFYPYSEMILNENQIRMIFKKNCNLSILKNLKKKYDINIDEKYLRIACCSRNVSISLLKYLIDICGIIPTIECLLLILHTNISRNINYIRKNMDDKYDIINIMKQLNLDDNYEDINLNKWENINSDSDDGNIKKDEYNIIISDKCKYNIDNIDNSQNDSIIDNSQNDSQNDSIIDNSQNDSIIDSNIDSSDDDIIIKDEYNSDNSDINLY
jgi:hypothetical protein